MFKVITLNLWGYHEWDKRTDNLVSLINQEAPDCMALQEVLTNAAVKSPQFSYNRLKGADPLAGVEMASTGEAACFGANLEEGFYTSWPVTEQHVGGKNVFISLPDEQKHKFIEEARLLQADGWSIYTTEGTFKYFRQLGISSTKLYKVLDKQEPSVSSAIEGRLFDLMINVPSLLETNEDAYKIRRLAIDNHIPILTNAETGRLLLRCISDAGLKNVQPKYLSEYIRPFGNNADYHKVLSKPSNSAETLL